VVAASLFVRFGVLAVLDTTEIRRIQELFSMSAIGTGRATASSAVSHPLLVEEHCQIAVLCVISTAGNENKRLYVHEIRCAPALKQIKVNVAHSQKGGISFPIQSRFVPQIKP
jgi:hypothetical protein